MAGASIARWLSQRNKGGRKENDPPFLIVGLLALSSVSALADDGCSEFKLPTGFAAVKMTAAQWHFFEGFWVVYPTTPIGMPPGDGAQIITKPGLEGAAIAVTKAERVCFMMTIPKKLLDYLEEIRVGPGEDM